VPDRSTPPPVGPSPRAESDEDLTVPFDREKDGPPIATPASTGDHDLLPPASLAKDSVRIKARAQAEPPSTAKRERVVVANPADGGVLYWTGKLFGFSALVLIAVIALTLVSIYGYVSVNAPAIPDFTQYANTASGVTRMYAADGTLLGEFAKERREIVPYERIPKPLIDAFLAVEDHEFFEHRGIYLKGIVRAAWRNVASGDFAQGGSTITQQVCKQFLGAEKSLWRKGLEAVCARRVEAKYSKQAILAVYLNHIYLGAGAWGVGAASETYFGKKLDQLTLAESALIAGLAKAPTKFSPISQPKLAVERRNVVLDKMAGYGFAAAAEVEKAKQEAIALHLEQEEFPKRLPYYADYVKSATSKKYGEDTFRSAGFRIETAAEPTWEAAAYDGADYSAHHQDRRQGWRGPEWRVEGVARERVIARQKEIYGAGPLIPDKRYLAIVDKVAGDGAEVLIGERKFQLPLRNMRWAAPFQTGNAENDAEIGSAHQALKPGYVIWVSRELRTVKRWKEWALDTKKNPSWIAATDQKEWDAKNENLVKLEQVPHPQVALFTGDYKNAHVVAMVGGYDYDRSVFNRVTNTRACRQPASSYKPIYYSLGFQEGYGFDTVLKDIPITIVDPETGEEWSPNNLGDTMDHAVTLEYALVFSKNIPSVDLFQRLGAKNVEAWARKLGFTTKIFADDALALGASCTYLHEMARAYSVFARHGAWWPRPKGKEKDWIYVRRIVGRSGEIVEDNTLASDPQLPVADRFDRIAALSGIETPQAIPARTGFLMSKLLNLEVQYGFTQMIRAVGLNAAGKTGTSSDTHDTIFIAYTPQFTTVAWMGDDKRERAIGRTDAAYITMVPLWARYMNDAAKGYPNPPWPWSVPAGLDKDDRGDHSKGQRGPRMSLIYKTGPPKPDAADDNRPDI
jgi:penicillin-binding protein 1A